MLPVALVEHPEERELALAAAVVAAERAVEAATPELGLAVRVGVAVAAVALEEGAEDDIADCFGILGRLADEFAAGDVHDDYDPALGSPGYNDAGSTSNDGW